MSNIGAFTSAKLTRSCQIQNVRSDYNIQKVDVNIFVETKLCLLDKDEMYQMNGFILYRNDFSNSTIRTCYGTAVYIKNDLN